MAFSMKVNDYDLKNLITITDVDRGATPERVYRKSGFPNGDGGRLTGGRFEMRKISVEFRMFGNLELKKDTLLKALPVYESKKIIFGDQTDRYYIARLSGSVSLDKRNYQSAAGSFELICEDPIAYSVKTKKATRNRNVLKFSNDGTSVCCPMFEFTPQRDLKMFALAHPNGKVVQIGSEGGAVVFPKNKKVVIDTQNRSVVVGGKEIQVNHASRWFALKSNATTEVIYTVDRNGTIPTVIGEYKERWL